MVLFFGSDLEEEKNHPKLDEGGSRGISQRP